MQDDGAFFLLGSAVTQHEQQFEKMRFAVSQGKRKLASGLELAVDWKLPSVTVGHTVPELYNKCRTTPQTDIQSDK